MKLTPEPEPNPKRVSYWLALPFVLIAYVTLFMAYQLHDCGCETFEEFKKTI